MSHNFQLAAPEIMSLIGQSLRCKGGLIKDKYNASFTCTIYT